MCLCKVGIYELMYNHDALHISLQDNLEGINRG